MTAAQAAAVLNGVLARAPRTLSLLAEVRAQCEPGVPGAASGDGGWHYLGLLALVNLLLDGSDIVVAVHDGPRSRVQRFEVVPRP